MDAELGCSIDLNGVPSHVNVNPEGDIILGLSLSIKKKQVLSFRLTEEAEVFLDYKGAEDRIVHLEIGNTEDTASARAWCNRVNLIYQPAA